MKVTLDIAVSVFRDISSVDQGQLFIFDDNLYLKTNDADSINYGAVSLVTGERVSFPKDEWCSIIPLEAVVVIKGND